MVRRGGSARLASPAMAAPGRLSDWKLWLLGALAGLLLVAAMAPAKAAACNSPIATKAGDGSITCVTDTSVGQSLTWCDRDADNHKVYARFSDSFTGSARWNTTVRVFGDAGYDPNGSSSGCGIYSHLQRGQRFYAWAVCVQYEGCSGWAHWPSYPVPTIPARLW
jgi:hypothetical protein